MPNFLTQLLGKSQEGEAKGPALWESTRETAAQTMEHAQALAELFRTELDEYIERRRIRMLCIALAAVMLLAAYELLCALLAVLLAPMVGLAMALGIVLLLNLCAATLLLTWAAAQSREPLAPATRTELKNDWKCLKLLIKGSAKS